MNVTVIGVGYVGLVTGVCFSTFDNKVKCYDIDKNKIDSLNNGISPIYEENLSEILLDSIKENKITFSSDLKESIEDSEIIFLCVGTPENDDGSANLDYVFSAAEELASCITNDVIVVCKSTVPVGTSEIIYRKIYEKLEENGSIFKVTLVSNPEFLREGSAVNDFLNPDRVIIGIEENDLELKDKLINLYEPVMKNIDKILLMPRKDAELAKYASNAMLATKISFINEISNICELFDVDVSNVKKTISLDPRIGSKFLDPGCGYGGSCFPKDVKALIDSTERLNFHPELLKSVDSRNIKQKEHLANKVIDVLGKNKKDSIAIWGLAFKPGTDDMREASSLVIINKLIENGFSIKAHDPISMDEAKRYLKNVSNHIEYYDDKYDTLDGSSALVVITEWEDFLNIDIDIAADRLSSNIIFDGRNMFDKQKFISKGWKYIGIGK